MCKLEGAGQTAVPQSDRYQSESSWSVSRAHVGRGRKNLKQRERGDELVAHASDNAFLSSEFGGCGPFVGVNSGDRKGRRSKSGKKGCGRKSEKKTAQKI